ncbi:hypothetical protein ACHAWF_015687 [Thalassiosira exigua]
MTRPRFPRTPRLSSFIAALIWLLLRLAPASSECSVYWEGTCRYPSATSNITLLVTDDLPEANVRKKYDAAVTFHWGPSDAPLGVQNYPTGEEVSEVRSHEYDAYGEYLVGYRVEFPEDSGSGCDGEILVGYLILTFNDTGSCGFVEVDEQTIQPTRSPSERPTSGPSSSPSASPTASPSISVGPSAWPSTSPSASPTGAPSFGGTHHGVYGGGWRTMAPTGAFTRPLAPAPGGELGNDAAPADATSPATMPTTKPTIPIRTHEVPSSTMVLFESELLDDASAAIWTTVTERTIRHTIVEKIFGATPELVGCDVTLEHQESVPDSAGGGGASSQTRANKPWKLRRDLPSPASPSALRITFSTIVSFPAREDEWDGGGMVSSGYRTLEQQRAYIDALKGEDEAYFQSVEKMIMFVDGVLVTEQEPEPEVELEESYVGSPAVADEEGAGDDGGSRKYIWIGVAAAGGSCLLIVGAGIGIYFTNKNKREERSSSGARERASLDSTPDTRMEISTQTRSHGDALSRRSENLGLTIERREGEGDDISTLGEPYFGEVEYPAIDSDNTVGQSMVSSQQELYVYGVRRPQSNFPTDASRFGASTVASKGLIFGGDGHLEHSYRPPSPGSSANEDQNSILQFAVVAPAGKLGIVLNNPTGDMPVVHAVKETSALHGKVAVGDALLSIDGVDCRSLTAHILSAFLNSRSENPARTLLLARRPGGGAESLMGEV